MASWRLLPNEKCRDNSNRIDHAKQTPLRLFEDWNRKRPDIIAEVRRVTPRDELWTCHFSLPSYTSELFVTSPTAKKTSPMPPNAPIKPRKLFSKVGLKPKRLRFTDKEKEEVENKNYHQKSVDCAIKVSNQKAEYSAKQIESKRKLSRENLTAILQNIRLETENKENRQYGKERYERKVRDGHFGMKEYAKCSNNSSQSSKVNCSPKGFRLKKT